MGLTVVAGLALMSAPAVWAGELASYNFSAGPAGVGADNVTAGSFTAGPGLSGYAGRSGSGNMYARSTGTYGSALSIGNAISSDDYISVTIGADSGFAMDLTSLTFDFGYTRSGGADGQRFKAYVLTSIDGFVDAGDITGSKEITVGAATGTPPYTLVTVDLSGAQFQGITTPTEFRFYLSDTCNYNDFIHRIDNVVLNGTIVEVVTKPSTIGLL